MKRRALLGAAGLSLVFAVVLVPPAFGAFRGSDMWSNLMPDGGVGGLVDRYPISSYALDHHVDNGISGLSNISASLAQFFASLFFMIGAVAMRVVIAMFEWASSANFITGGNGVLGPASVISKQYYDDIVTPFLTTALILFGVWIAYKAHKREAGEAGSAIVRVVCMSALAIAIVFHPAETVGRAFSFIGDASEAVISLGQGTQSASDTIFETFVYRPWAVLEFGGLSVCTGDKKDADGFPLAATSSNPATKCHSVLHSGPDGHGGYAKRFLSQQPESDARNKEYEVLKNGEVDSSDPQFGPGYKVDRTDSPAVDMMQEGGALQRFAFSLVVLVGIVGGVLLLGLISIAQIFAQVALLLLVMLTPFMILAAAHPSMHGYYMKWLKWLRLALIAGLVYSVMLAITLSTSRALMAVGGGSDAGYFIAFTLQAVLFLGVFFKRKAITDAVLSKKDAARMHQTEHHTTSAVSSAATSVAALGSGVGEAAMVMRQGWQARNGSSESEDHHTLDSTSPPASAGREHSPAPEFGQAPAPAPADSLATSTSAPPSISTVAGDPQSVPSSTSDTSSAQPVESHQAHAPQPSVAQPESAPDEAPNEGETMPTTSFRSDLADARAQRYDEEYSPSSSPPAAPQPDQPPPTFNGLSSAHTFERDLEQERHEQDLARRE